LAVIKRVLLVVVGLVVVVVVGSVLLVFITDDAGRDDGGRVTEEGMLSVSATDGEQRDIEAVPCSEPHDGEVYTNIKLGDGEFPGDEFIASKADRGCSARLRRQAPKSRDEIVYFVPNKLSWDEKDDRTVTCIAQYPKKRTGTVAAQ
jgi:hypothetical protein